ncbi:S1C family serine protease [Sporosarcina sp. G11-34]|uniref:S1C family serine protease n=1 Tax=Sporosarcina sp. G11-34 TaxID=2849605 RepID=UPI0022A8E638|nr:trypsin-like peptidase domain-containing protein [Sporosarcina sp. G11-34]MCZ2259060.1 trypsin-like peptidase domain-containing protein [Sporosarcina sp. G11-34]
MDGINKIPDIKEPGHHESEHERVDYKKRNEKPPKKKSNFIMGLLFGVVVSIVIWFLVDGKMGAPKPVVNEEKTAQTERISIDINTDVTEIVEQVADTVVGVTNLQRVRDIWSSSEMTEETGTGSGVIYKKQGGKAYIVSNHHVVEGAEELDITFDDGTKVEGRLIGSDIWTDLAVIEVDAVEVKAVAAFGDSDALKRGETVMAIGNPLGLGFSGSVTVGVVSGKDRSIPIDFNNDGQVDWYADVLQTDAAINPGNSGGALMNLAGQLIGINSMKISQETVEGIGLAIPINLAIPIIEKLEKHGEVHRPTMGVTLIDLSTIPAQQQRGFLNLPTTVTEGVVVNEVIRNSPSQIAGVEQYDVIIEMDGEKINDMISLRKHLFNEKEIGDTMRMKVYRGNELLEIEMVLKDGNSL